MATSESKRIGAGDDRVVARAFGNGSRSFRRLQIVQEGIDLVDVLGGLHQRQAVNPGDGAFLRRRVVDRLAVLLERQRRAIPGQADPHVVLHQARLGVVGRIPELTRVLAGPWATQLLADLGAEVIKIEKPGEGDDTRGWGPPFITNADGSRGDAAYFLSANRGKRRCASTWQAPKARS